MARPPLTAAQRVARAQARQVDAGWRRINLRLRPGGGAALDVLLAAGYGQTPTACIERALKEAATQQAKYLGQQEKANE